MKSLKRNVAVAAMVLGMGAGFVGCEIDTDDDEIFKASENQEQVQAEQA